MIGLLMHTCSTGWWERERRVRRRDHTHRNYTQHTPYSVRTIIWKQLTS